VHVVGLIPARGGSKGIPGKNLTPLAGKPLIAHTIEAALAAAALTRTVVSTDSSEIARVARAQGAEVPFLRPAKLAADDTPMRDVVLHGLGALDRCDVLVLLQPTSPLRRAEHVDEAVGLLLGSGADSVISVVEVPHRYSPGSLMELVDGRLVPTFGDGPTRRQDKRPLYARNGPAVLAVRAEAAWKHAVLWGGDCRPYVMAPRDSVDVDNAFDLELAEFLLRSVMREPT
jgi:CMP-N,N'-diacetyllegionaminic acid synthase